MVDTATATAIGKYLYGIISCAEGRTFSVPGAHALGPRVYTIPYGDIAAVVSDAPLDVYDGTRRHMLAHARVLEAVMREHTVLPIGFGAVAPDAATVRDLLLARCYDDLVAQLAALASRVELGLQAFWVADDLFGAIVAQSAAIRGLRDSLAGLSAEQTYAQRIKLGELVEAEIGRRREQEREAILVALRPLATDLRVQPVRTDRMVLSAAFLIEREREDLFDRAIRALDTALGQHLMFKYVGPVPPYSFVNVSLCWL